MKKDLKKVFDQYQTLQQVQQKVESRIHEIEGENSDAIAVVIEQINGVKN